jgi:hypothetical protein
VSISCLEYTRKLSETSVDPGVQIVNCFKNLVSMLESTEVQVKAFHGENRGSIPLGSANRFNGLQISPLRLGKIGVISGVPSQAPERKGNGGSSLTKSTSSLSIRIILLQAYTPHELF